MADDGVVVDTALAVIARVQNQFVRDTFVQRGLVGQEQFFVDAHLAGAVQ